MRRLVRQGLRPCLLCFALGAAGRPSVSAAHSVWTEQSAPTVLALNAVRFYHRADGWAAGDEGVMLRFRNGAWENAPSGTDRKLNDLAVLGTGDAWAVGEAGTIIAYRRHLRTDEQEKRNVVVPGQTTTTRFNESFDFVMPGNATYEGPLSMAVEPDSQGTPTILGVFWARTGDGPFEAGAPPAGTTNPLVIRLVVDRLEIGRAVSIAYTYRQTNPTWRKDEQGSALTLLPLRAVAFLTPDIGWAVGGGAGPQGGIALRYNGTGWITATTTIDALYDVETVADDLVWACGSNRRILKFDGTQFTSAGLMFGVPPPGDWRTIAFPYRSVGYVAGDGGAIWRFSSSLDYFYPVASPVGGTIRALSLVTGSGVGYAVGDGGSRVHVNGAAFEDEATGGADLRAVHMLNELEGVAVGGTGGPRILGLRLHTTETDLVNARVFPNPFDPNGGETLKLDRLPTDVTQIEIFTLRGERLAALGDGVVYSPVTGQAEWTGRIRGGKPAANGAYVYRIGTAAGKRGKGIVLVVKR